MSLETLDKDAFAKLSHESFVVYLCEFHRVILFLAYTSALQVFKAGVGLKT